MSYGFGFSPFSGSSASAGSSTSASSYGFAGPTAFGSSPSIFGGSSGLFCSSSFGPTSSATGSAGPFATGNPASGAPFGQSSSNGSQCAKKASTGVTVTEITEDGSEKIINFLRGFFVAFKEQIHTDIQLKPNDGPCIPAHRALLAARSKIFKNILDSDGCKAPPSHTDTIALSELNTEELESFLEFLYTGTLPTDKLKKHVYTLYVAADKYEIPYLQESCEHYLLNSLNASNALKTLEVSDAHSNETMKKTTLNFIVANMKDIVSTKKYEDFASSSPHLSVQITRAFVGAKCK